MPGITDADLDRMRSMLFFDGPGRHAKLSRFWILLALAACIASAGVSADSTATVIGAMIVAPLMIPIMGMVLAISTSDRDNLVRSVLLVAFGAVAAVAIGYLFGLMSVVDVVADTSSQVEARVNPRLIDLVAALATGAAGAFAQCRDDVSDTLPGVAIAISLVPPLAVVGLTMEAGAYEQSTGALLLFLTNVAAIMVSGVVVMAVYRVPQRSLSVAGRSLNRRRAIVVITAFAVVIAAPLAAATTALTQQILEDGDIADAAGDWADDVDWRIVDIRRVDTSIEIIAAGPLPLPDAGGLRAALDAAGLADVSVDVRLVPEERVELPGR